MLTTLEESQPDEFSPLTRKQVKNLAESLVGRRRTKAAILRLSRSVFVEVFKRIPLDAQKVLGDVRPLTIEVFEDPNEASGVYANGVIYVNATTSWNRPKLTWTLAHELAHAYLGWIGANARRGASSAATTSREAELATEGCIAALGDGNPTGVTGLGPLPDRTSSERLADAVALAWGFGAEAALSYGLNRASPRKEYLDPVLIDFVDHVYALERCIQRAVKTPGALDFLAAAEQAEKGEKRRVGRRRSSAQSADGTSG